MYNVIIQEVDLACIPLAGTAGYDILELAVYVLGDAYAIFTKYPKPHTATEGPIRVFSVNVMNLILLLPIM